MIHVLGSIGINTGQNLQAMALSELDEEAMKKPWKSRSWLIGCIMFISCSILNFVVAPWLFGSYGLRAALLVPAAVTERSDAARSRAAAGLR